MNRDLRLSQAMEKAMREAADRLLAEHIMTEENFARASLAYRLSELRDRRPLRHEFGTNPCLTPRRPFLKAAMASIPTDLIRKAIKRSIR